MPHRKPFGKPEEVVRFRVSLSATDWARPDPADSIGMPSANSCIHSLANSPRSVSAKILRISASFTTRGPRVRIAYSQVRLRTTGRLLCVDYLEIYRFVPKGEGQRSHTPAGNAAED